MIKALFALLICLSKGFCAANDYEGYLKLEDPDLYRGTHEQKLRKFEWKIQSDELRREKTFLK